MKKSRFFWFPFHPSRIKVVLAEFKKVLKEEDMQSVMEAPEAPAKYQAPEGTWIQITFTLDPEHYRTLWERVEEEHRTIPGFVRESVIDFLEEIKSAS